METKKRIRRKIHQHICTICNTAFMGERFQWTCSKKCRDDKFKLLHPTYYRDYKNSSQWKEYDKQYYLQHRQERIIEADKWRRANREANRASSRRSIRKYRLQAQAVLGGKCVVCGNTDWRVLQVNHLNGNPHKEFGMRLFRQIVKDKHTSPVDLRCANCNIIYEFEKGRRGQGTHFNTVLRRKWKSGAVAKLGGKCVACGINDERILVLNHINGGGAKHRKARKNQSPLYLDVIRGKYLDLVDLRCANCNVIYEYTSGRIES